MDISAPSKPWFLLSHSLPEVFWGLIFILYIMFGFYDLHSEMHVDSTMFETLLHSDSFWTSHEKFTVLLCRWAGSGRQPSISIPMNNSVLTAFSRYFLENRYACRSSLILKWKSNHILWLEEEDVITKKSRKHSERVLLKQQWKCDWPSSLFALNIMIQTWFYHRMLF